MQPLKPLVSVIIPAFNAERWIEESIRSAIDQSWQNKEIIIVDDGSTDNTLGIARMFESKAVKVVQQPNAGASAARNKGLQHAQGDFIQWLDADDLLAPDKISRQIGEGGKGEARTLFSSGYGNFYYRRHKAQFSPSALWQTLAPVDWYLTKFNDDVFMIPAVWLVTRTLTEEIGPWDERLTFNDDGEYFGRAVAASDCVRFVPEAKSYYRQANSSSLSNLISHKACKSLLLSLSLCIGYLLRMESSDRTRRAALNCLQSALIYFYPEEEEMLEKLNALADELGGRLAPPEIKSKYLIIKKLFGWPAAKKMAFTLPKIKQYMIMNYDQFMFSLVNNN